MRTRWTIGLALGAIGCLVLCLNGQKNNTAQIEQAVSHHSHDAEGHTHGDGYHHHGDGVMHTHSHAADHHQDQPAVFNGKYSGFKLGDGATLVAFHAPEKDVKPDRLKWSYRADLGVVPEDVMKGIAALHGGSVEDPDDGKIYTCYPGAGLHVLDADLKTWKFVDGSDAVFKGQANSHGICVWKHKDQKGLAIASTNDGTVYITDMGGKVLHKLTKPTGVEFDDNFINVYYKNTIATEFNEARAKSVYGVRKVKKDDKEVEVVNGPTFSPTCVAFLDGTFYVTTGYSTGDFVLCAVVDQKGVPQWGRLGWGRRDEGENRHLTAHGVRVRKDEKGKDEVVIASRHNFRVYTNSPQGQHLKALALPDNSLVCNTSEGLQFQFYPLLDPIGAENERFASVLIYEGDKRVGRINAGEHLHPLAADQQIDADKHRFVHIHHVLVVKRKGSNGKDTLFAVIQSWNKGGTAIFELLEVAPEPVVKPKNV